MQVDEELGEQTNNQIIIIIIIIIVVVVIIVAKMMMPCRWTRSSGSKPTIK